MPNPFNPNKQFYFKQISLALVHSLIAEKNFPLQGIQFSQTVLMQSVYSTAPVRTLSKI